ncbi:MAG: putative photosynthetic complex assembly protein PuhC [Burkholderiaceae bacterium]|jgi:putative photosynthetic complex assembly protein|nr:putative photosynthetic complex assembly protein PuhC [Burkholderiaceae bacterium]
MSEHVADTPEQLPRGVLLSIAALVAVTIASVALVRLSGVDIRLPDAAAVQSRALQFIDRPDGGIAVIDAVTGHEVSTLHGENGFVRGALRALARERRMRGIDGTPPFVLIGRADGRLTLDDPATGQRIDLESFGPMHAGRFAQLLRSEPAAPSPAAPR